MNLEQLNPQQRKAVKLTGGPILIFAGAGSGKTRVLTHKIAYLVQEVGLPTDNILAVTFTNKAADEMKKRVQELLNMDVSAMSVGTFHSISARILRKEIHQLGYNNDFVIYDMEDSRALVKGVIRDLNLDEKTFLWRQCILKNDFGHFCRNFAILSQIEFWVNITEVIQMGGGTYHRNQF